MCGIFTILNNNDTIISRNTMNDAFQKGKHRGPEYSVLNPTSIKTIMGFHRLAINGLDDISHQPIIIDDIILICNGEIYNYKKLFSLLPDHVRPITNSDCEIIIHLYKEFGIESTLQMLDGVFAFVLLDQRLTNETSKIYIARDPYGVRPLYSMTEMTGSTNNTIAFASE